MKDDIRLETKEYEVYIHTDHNRGFFEHKKHGDEMSGGLWFKDKELIDYDGVYNLPYEIAMAINQLTDYNVLIEECCDYNEIKENEC